MKRILMQALFALFFGTSLFAQSDKCYTDKLIEKRYQSDPVFAQQFDAWRTSIVQIAQQNQVGSQRGALYTIPIVFHLVLSTAQLNTITDNTIAAQLNTLNKDFRKQNGDTSSIRSTFKPLASDIEIQFCFAVRDPNGNSATGITRTATTHGAWDPDTEGDDMKFTASGGINAWQPTKYINVWIVDIVGSQFGGTAGYAYLGGGSTDGTAIDGIVLDYQLGFGANNRSLSHEMGHYMGLFHTWGTANSCSNDDGIADTPESFTANFGCDYTENSCNTGTGDLPDQIENYMDYSDCAAMFTAQQKTVMRNVLTSDRGSLLTSTGCQAVNTPPVADFYAASTIACTGNGITFTNTTTGGATSWSWSFPGGTPSTSTQQNPSVTYSTAGTYNVALTATNTNGSDTETKTGYITVGTGISATIFSENFEGSISGWTIVNPDNSETWAVVSGVAGSLPGDRAARVHLFDYQTEGQRDGLVSPVINLSGKTNVSLTFNYAHRRYGTDTRDSLIVYVSTNGGNSYTRVYANAEDDATGASFATGTLTQNDFIPASAADWCAASATGVTCPVIDLNAYSGQGNFRIKFETFNDYGNNIYIDNIVVTGTCSAPTGPAPVAAFTANNTSGCNSVSVNFTDQSTNTPTSWSWQFTGGTPGTSTQQNPTVTYSTAGTYAVTLTATNANGSDGETKTGYITVHASPTLNSTSVSTACAGASTGSINLSVSGNPNYTYQWSNSATTQDISNLAAGQYTVTVTDGNGCTASRATTVSAGSGFSTTISKVDASCVGVNNGSINLSITGGNTPYTYVWSNGATSQDLNGLESNSYSVTVTDGNSCTASNTATISTGSGPSVSATAFNVTCAGVNDGIVDVSVSGGSAPLTYLWSNGATTQDLTQVGPGSYNVTVTDGSGCTATGSESVGNGFSLVLNATVHDDSMHAGNGSIMVLISGGASPYTYTWSNGDTALLITGLHEGTYGVTATDANGCEGTGAYIVANDTSVVIGVQDIDKLSYSVYPNPTDGLLNVQVSLAVPGTLKITLYNAIGQAVLSQSAAHVADVNTTFDVSMLEDGIYFLRMENDSKTAVSRVAVMRKY